MNRHSPDLSWQDHAACRGQHDLFDPSLFGRREHPAELRRQREAVAICRQCPVIVECRRWALHYYEDDDAVIGGLTGKQRRQIRNALGLNRPRLRLDLALCGHPSLDGICLCNRPRKATA